MSTKSSLMALKVTYEFENNQVFMSKCASNLKVKYGEMELYNNETRLIGVVKLRECVRAVVKSSPEVLSNLATKHDYNIYVCDYSEADTPLVGYGLLSKLIDSDFCEPAEDEAKKSKSQKQRDILIPGKVEACALNALFGAGRPKYTLSVKLSFKKIERPRPALKPQGGIRKPQRPIARVTKRVTNHMPAPMAHRTLSMPVRPIEFLPPNTNITNNQIFAKEIKEYTSRKPEPKKSVLADQSYLDQSSLMNIIINDHKQMKESDVSDFSLNGLMSSHDVSSAPTSDNSDEQGSKMSNMNDLFGFNTDSFFMYNEEEEDEEEEEDQQKPQEPANATFTPLAKHMAPELPSLNSEEDNATPKDSDALTPIIETAYEHQARCSGTSPVYNEDDDDSKSVPLVSSPFAVYE